MPDFRSIETQEDLEELFKKTLFTDALFLQTVVGLLKAGRLKVVK